MKFSDTLQELDQISRQLRNDGITVDKLDQAISDLKKHQSNIEKIEQNIEAIKQEVIKPIQGELEQNKLAGKFSVIGFWIGAIGLVVSIATVVFQFVPSIVPSTPSTRMSTVNNVDSIALVKKLESIEQQLLFPKPLNFKDGEVFVKWNAEMKLASDGDKELFLEVRSIDELPKGGGLTAGLRFFRGSNQIGREVLAKGFQRADGEDGPRDWCADDEICVAEGDVLSLANANLKVTRILSTNPSGRALGDEVSGVIVKVDQ